jgi:L-seryl-tRNA(Ser) seleniumtransferase
MRAQAVAGTLGAPEVRHEALANALAARVQARLAPRMRAVLNLTGTVIHTNLGRALLADAALQRLLR